MAVTARFIPKALDVADTWTILVGGVWLAGETVTLTIGNRDLVLTVGSVVTTAGVATDIKELWNGDSFTDTTASASETGNNVPEFEEAAATVASSTVTITALSTLKGKPIGLSAATDSVSGTLTVTNTVVATGQEWWDNADNWDTGAVPTTGDTVYIDKTSVSIRHGLAQSAVTLAALYILQDYTGDIGLPEVDADGGYEQYRAGYLAIGATILQIGSGSGTGSGRLKINTGTVQTTLTVFNTGSPSEADLPAVIWKGTHAAGALTHIAGSVGVAIFGGEVATLATVTRQGGDLVTGSGVTLSGALTQNDGTWLVNSAIATSLTQLGGTTTIEGTGAVAQLTIRGGLVTYNTTGTLGGTTVVSGGGVLDFGQNPSAKTVTNPIDLYGTAAQVLDPNKVVSSLIVDLNEGGTSDQVSWGPDIRLTRGATA